MLQCVTDQFHYSILRTCSVEPRLAVEFSAAMRAMSDKWCQHLKQPWRIGAGASQDRVAPRFFQQLENCACGSAKRHLQPRNAFSGLLMRPKCICGRGPAPNPSRELVEGARCPFPPKCLPTLGLRKSEMHLRDYCSRLRR